MLDYGMANVVAACKESPACAPAKHHFDECTARVTKAIDEEGSANEDCVEECTLFLSPDFGSLATPTSIPPAQQPPPRRRGL